MLERVKKSFVEGTLQMHFSEKEKLDEGYRHIVDNTVRMPYPKDLVVIDTSNVLYARNMELSDFMEGEDKELLESGSVNHVATDTTFLMDEYVPAQGTPTELVDLINSTTTLSAVVVHDYEEARRRFSEIDFMTMDLAKEIIADIGFHHIPLGANAAGGILSTAVGVGRPINSVMNIGTGKLKREFTVMTTNFLGKNIDTQDNGELKVTFHKGAGYVSNFKDLYADEATELMVEAFQAEGYDDFAFTEGMLTTYGYEAVFTSEKLGGKTLVESNLDGSNAVAKIVFRTSDYGLSSLNMTPILEFSIKTGMMGAERRVSIALSDMVYLNHNASIDEENGVTMKTLWNKKIEELFSIVKETSERLSEADGITINYPGRAFENLLEHLGVPVSLPEREAIYEDFIEDFVMDSTARDLYVHLFVMINQWAKTNTVAALRAQERLNRILVSRSWKKFDVISTAV